MTESNGNQRTIRIGTDSLTRGLGWFSIGLGVAQVVAPRALSRVMGVKAHPLLWRVLGAREITTGIGILTRAHPAGWMQARVAGDAIDLALIGSSLRAATSHPIRLAAAGAAVAGVAALDMICGRELARVPDNGRSGITFSRTITINRSPEEMYKIWRNFAGLPCFMQHLVSVEDKGDGKSHWVAKGPAGTRVEWDAELVEDLPDKIVGWRSLPGADVENSGTVQFERATGGRGTVVRVKLSYRPPAGKAGATLAKFLGQAPEKQIQMDLLRMKQSLETGEMARTEGQPAGRSHSTSPKFDKLLRA